MSIDDQIDSFLDTMGDYPPTFVELGDGDRRTWETDPAGRETIQQEATTVAMSCGDRAIILHIDDDVVCLGRANKSGKWQYLILDGDDRFDVNDLFGEEE